MSDGRNPFSRLAPFLQEYIYGQEWAELRPIQVAACKALFGSDAHVLLASATASGKTEAAFLPIITMLYEQPALSVGVLYISPLKALINDQFGRLGDMLRDADIPVWHWHGDVPQSHKQKLLRNPSGILQITPESLESLFLNRGPHLMSLFGDLRFVVVDEVHALMDSDRGRQLLCQLTRLERRTPARPRRVGLSATLGDYAAAEAWLASGTRRPVVRPPASDRGRRVRVSLEHFTVDDPADRPDSTAEPEPDAVDRYVFAATKGRKSLIFVNRRGDAEEIIAALRRIAERAKLPDIYHVHHGSIAATLRTAAETAMREDERPTVTAATITLELGIDIGQLERVVQLDAPFTVSSFVQRLGRSGRRGEPSELWFVTRERPHDAFTPVPEQIPWSLLQSIAIIQLYLEEHWIEPKRAASLPASLLYHQTLSILTESGELRPAELAARVLTLPPFQDVSQDDFRTLLRHLIAIDHIQRTDEGGLIVGLAGERIVRDFHFYAVFADGDEYVVQDGAREVGSIAEPPLPGERFGLAGRTWEVIEIDSKRRTILAKRVGGRVATAWTGAGGDVHTRILERMRRVLSEETGYAYLGPAARERLAGARAFARNIALLDHPIVRLGPNSYCLFPWMGSVAMETLQRVFAHAVAPEIEARRIAPRAPYFLTFDAPDTSERRILAAIKHAVAATGGGPDLVRDDEAPLIGKFDEFVPEELRRTAYGHDRLDVAEVRTIVATW